jgi:DNA repair protein RadC
LFSYTPKLKKRHTKAPQEFKVIALREAPNPDEQVLCETSDDVVANWRSHIETAEWYRSEQECVVAIFLNTRKRILGHHLVTIGILDQMLAHPREIFRTAIIFPYHSMIVAHNRPGEDPTPSEADLRVTRDLIRAGQLIKIEVVDHAAIGDLNHVSLRDLGYCSI